MDSSGESVKKADESQNDESGKEVFKKPIAAADIRLKVDSPKVIKSCDLVSSEEAAKSSEEDGCSSNTSSSSSSEGGEKEALSNQLWYKKPHWADIPKESYSLEVLKNGAIIDCIDLTKRLMHVFGRYTSCDIVLSHATISRFHAVLVHKAKETEDEMQCGYYLYDLGSSHGTFLNKNRLNSKVYYRVRVGHMIKFGLSTRTYILNGPEDDREEESELSLTEMKARKQQELDRAEEEKKRAEEEGVNWGIVDYGEDCASGGAGGVDDDSDDSAENPFAISENQDFYRENPKKVLTDYMEAEGVSLKFSFKSKPAGGGLQCSCELPIDDSDGNSMQVEASSVSGKDDAIFQCCLEACRLLDLHGVLRPILELQQQQLHKRSKAEQLAENDFYESDDDDFYDRTGSIEKKRQKRIESTFGNVKTFESLAKK